MAIRIKRRPLSGGFKWRAGKPLASATARYNANLRRLIARLERWTELLILPIVERNAELTDAILDAPQTGFAGALAEFDRRVGLLELGEAGIEMVEPALRANDQFNRKAFVSGLKKVIGVDVSSIMNESMSVSNEINAAIQTNIELIKSIPEKYLDSLTSVVTEGLKAGDDYQSIRKEIRGLGQSTRKRAKFIARDQLSKFNNSVNRIRQENLGVTRYRWRTAGDSRVSEDHADNDGLVFEWANPPATGHPGERPNCRCVAEPYLEDVWAQLNNPGVKPLETSRIARRAVRRPESVMWKPE